jgi:ankyrin repeat protein
MINIDFNKEIDKLENIVLEIFKLIKSQDWKSLLKLIKSNDIDYNIKDNSNIWLIEYLIMFNQIELIEVLLTKNIRIDVCDEQNKTILYSVIKFSYIPILKLLLEKDKTIIGQSVLDVKDNEENIPLFYAIKFFNIEAIKLILDYQTNLYIKNVDGENALHLAVKTMNLEIFKIILSKLTDINVKKNNGENSLNLAIKYKCYDIINFILEEFVEKTNKLEFNNKETKYGFSILHYIFLSLDFQLIVSFSKYFIRFDTNIQDKSGNIFLHYFINNIIQNNSIKIEDIDYTISEIKKLNIDYNLFNIDGNTPCHIMLLHIDIFKNKYNLLINVLIERTNLNIQNKNGESCLFLLIKSGYWKSVSNILSKKKLDVFIIDKNRKTIFEYLDTDDTELFVEILTNSYLYILTNLENSKKWLDYWDNRCKKNVNLTELNETEKELIQHIKLDNNKPLCFNIINNKLKNFIINFKKDKKIHDKNSYPIHIKYSKLIETYPDIIVPTFTGSTIDILTGLMYLNTKHKKTITTSLNLIDLHLELVNCKNNICEMAGFEILWKNYRLFLPSSKFNDLLRELTRIKMNKNSRFFIIPIGIEMNTNEFSYGHANMLIFDFETLQVERFEPHGQDPPYGLEYDAKLLDNVLENTINFYKLGFVYISPSKYLPKIGFQIKEIYELKNDYIGDPNGFCATWCLWWSDIRITHSNIDRKKLVEILFKEIINEDISYKKLIRNYSGFITKIRDKILEKINININDWINDTLTLEQQKLLDTKFKNEIKHLTE